MLIPGGMHVQSLKKGDVVLNANQTASLLKSGKAFGNGKAYASGTAYNMMPAHSSPAGISTGGNTMLSPSGIRPTSVGNTPGNNNYNKYIKADTTATQQHSSAMSKSTQVLDWVARRLQYFADKTKEIADTISDYVSYEFANKQLNKQIKAVQKEKNANANGYVAYMAKANSVRYTETSKDKKGKTVSKEVELSDKYKNLVESGAWKKNKWKIQDMDTSTENKKALYDAIQKYQDYYDKAQDCAEATRELTQTEKELRVQRLENIAANYDGKAQLKASRISNIQSSMDVDNATGKKVGTTAIKNSDAYKEKRTKIKSSLKSLQSEEDGLINQRAALTKKLKNSKGKQKLNIQIQLADVNSRLSQNKSQQKSLSNQLKISPNAEKKQYESLIKNSKGEVTDLTNKKKRLTKEFDKLVSDGTIKKYSSEWYKWKEEIAGIDDEINQCKVDQAEWNETIANLPIDKLKDANERLQVKAGKIQDKIDIKEARGGSANENDYNKLISNTTAQNKNLKEQNYLLEEQRNKYDVGTDKWKEYQAQIDTNNSSIADNTKNQIEWRKSIVNLPIENAAKKTQKLSDALSLLEKKLNNATSTAAKASILNKEIKNTRDTYNTNQDAVTKAEKQQKGNANKVLSSVKSRINPRSYRVGKDGMLIPTKEATGADQSNIALHNNLNNAKISGKKMDLSFLDKDSKEYGDADKYNLGFDAIDEARKTAAESEQDYIANVKNFAEQLANLPTEKMDKKLEDINTAQELLDAKYSVAEGSSAKNKILYAQDKKAGSELTSYKNRATETGQMVNSLWNNAALKSVKNNSANKGRDEGQKLSTAGLQKGTAAYEAVIKYNAAIDANKKAVTEAEKAEYNYTKTIQDNAKTRFDNTVANYEADLNLNTSKQGVTQSLSNLRTTNGTISKYSTTYLNDTLKEQNDALAIQQTQLKKAKKSYDKNKANMSEEDRKAAEATINDLQAKVYDTQASIAETEDSIKNMPLEQKQDDLKKLGVSADKLNDKMSLNNVKGIKATSNDYKDLIQNSSDQVKNLEDQNKELEKQQEGLDANSEKYMELQNQIDANDASIRDAQQSQEEWNNSIIALPIEKIERELELLDSIANLRKSEVDLKSKQGLDLTETDYTDQIRNNTDQIAQWTEKQNDYRKNMLTAMASTDGVYGGKTAEEWQQEMNNAGVQVNNLKSANEELKDSMRDDVYWRDFERAHEAAQRLKDDIDGIAGLISDDMVFDADGKLTDFGLSKVATNVKDLEIARGEVQNYTNDIANLNKLYAEGQYTEEEYKNKLAELKNGVLDSASAMKTATDAIVDMYKSMGQAELDSLFEVIDARKEALTAKKGWRITPVFI